MRRWPSLARSALLTLCMLHAGSVAAETSGARYTDPTDRYPHGVLGDAIEWGGLRLEIEGGKIVSIILPLARVFEDVAPRLFDVDSDGDLEVIVVETSTTQGAQLAIYDETGKIAATPYIGMRNRWLAPIGAADLDGDGMIEIAYIDRPHLRKTLRVWRYSDGSLIEVAQAGGFTNHKIGEQDIGGGIRTCDVGPEMITASADWRRIIATQLVDGQLVSRDIGAYSGRASLNTALGC